MARQQSAKWSNAALLKTLCLALMAGMAGFWTGLHGYRLLLGAQHPHQHADWHRQDNALEAHIVHSSMKSSSGDQANQQSSSAGSTKGSSSTKSSASTGMSPSFIGTLSQVSLSNSCHMEEHAEYDAPEVVRWGSDHIKDTAGECCQACKDTAGCNIWVWCGDIGGCSSRLYKECWLKKKKDLNYMDIQGARGPMCSWTSGALYDDSAKQAAVDQEAARLVALRSEPELPLVFLDVAIKGQPIGRIEVALFTKQSPRAAENFRALCTGEKGVAPEGAEGAGKAYHLKGAPFYRIIDEFIDQAGVGTDSVFGGQFKDDRSGLALKHDRKGLLSMANAGPDTNTSHFSILLAPAPHLDGKYTIFGEVVTGMEVVRRINDLSHGKPDNTATAAEGAVIINSGQIRQGAKPVLAS